MMEYGEENWFNIGSGNGLLPDGTKPSPEQMLTSKEIPQPSNYQNSSKISLKIIYLNSIQISHGLIDEL